MQQKHNKKWKKQTETDPSEVAQLDITTLTCLADFSL